jgi:hypothetical protein
MVNVEKAIAFVQANGDIIEQARLASVLWGKRPDKSVLQKIAGMQKPDGGFAYWIKDFSTICDPVFVLTWFDDFSIRSGTFVKRAIKFLLTHQKEDGGWDELEKVKETNPPPFLMPGEINTRVWITANCAHWFVRLGYAEPPEAKGCPVKFLLAHRESSGRLIGYLRATWDALVLFSYHPGPDSNVFKQTLNIIEKEFSPKKWEGSYLAWLGCCLRDAGLPANHSLVKQCLSELLKKQRLDGSWDSEDGEKYAANATVQALRVIKYYGAI